MNKILQTTLLTSMTSTATTLIFEPGQPMQAIEPTSNGYVIMDIGGQGAALVQNVSNIEIIHSGDAPATHILNDQGEANTIRFIRCNRRRLVFLEEEIEEK